VHLANQPRGYLFAVDLQFAQATRHTVRWMVDVRNITDTGDGSPRVVLSAGLRDVTSGYGLGRAEDFGGYIEKTPAANKQSAWGTAGVVVYEPDVRVPARHVIRAYLFSRGYADVYSLGLIWEVTPT
jgi:hypothetical protein